MNAETVHAFALLGLRALADYDASEFQRTTDLSRRDLDRRIDFLLEQIRDEAELHELRRQVDDLRRIVDEAESQTALSFLLRQMSVANLQHAQSLAMRYTRVSDARGHVQITVPETRESLGVDDSTSNQESYLRLAIMRLLRELPEYTAKFNFRWKRTEIDCLLEPSTEDYPYVLIEFKPQLWSDAVARQALQSLRRAGSGWGSGALFVLIVLDFDSRLREQARKFIPTKLANKTFVLQYDVEHNEFFHESEGPLLRAVREFAE
jgi:hypothetical protein